MAWHPWGTPNRDFQSMPDTLKLVGELVFHCVPKL
jgi:hypothetical protein